MNRKIVVVAVSCLFAGIVIGYLAYPYLLPAEPTIYTKLQQAGIAFSGSQWLYYGLVKLREATRIEQVPDFESFQRTHQLKFDAFNRDPNSSTYPYVYLDFDWNVVWIKNSRYNNTEVIEYIGFYFYTEPD